jgi:YVTN family beta-propeller protein
VLGEHTRILRAAFAAHDGQEVDNQGDSFFVAFRTAKDAVAAAVDAQRDLEAHPWPEGSQVRVRMGMHTGEPRVGGERYVGIGVNRAARIGAAGHGGQVLLSSTTKELAEEDLPPGVTIRDLGERRLKDLDQRQRLYQLVIEGLPSEFKALRTVDVELKRKRRRMYAGSALIGVAVVAIAMIFALGQGSSGLEAAPNSVAVIDPNTNRVSNDISVGARPAQIVSGFGALWVANLGDATVSRIDSKTRRVAQTVSINDKPTGLAAGAGKIWYASNGRKLVAAGNVVTKIKLGRIDPVYNSVVGTIELKTPAQAAGSGGSSVGPVAAGRRAVWVTSANGVTRIDSSSGRESHTDAGTAWNSVLSGIAVGAGATWVSDQGLNRVLRVDPAGEVTTPISVGHAPSGIAVGEGAVWVADTGDDEVKRIDPVTNSVETTINVGRSPTGVAVGPGAVWVANSGDGTVSRIDPRTDAVTKIVTVGGSPVGIAVADGLVWVSVQEEARGPTGSIATGPKRNTAFVAVTGLDYTDPALNSTVPGWQVENATCAMLLRFSPAPASGQLVPEVASSLPSLSADRRTYTYTIRSGFRFSPPSTQSVTAATFKYSIERSLRMNGDALTLLSDIVGARAFNANKTPHVAGIRAQGNTLTIRLTRVSGSFPSRLAMPFFCAVPIGTPPDSKGLPAIPSAGPYYVASYQPNRQLILKRNPNYRGPRPHRLNEIDVALNLGERDAVKDVETGRGDYVAVSYWRPSGSESGRLAARYGPASALGRAGKQRYFVTPWLGIVYYALNTSRPLFANARMRQAVNFAIDRPALANAQQTNFLALPADQYLPPGMLGFEEAHIYPTDGPDLARARQLAGGGRRTAVLYAGDSSNSLRRAQVLVRNLAAIGIRVKIEAFSGAVLDTKATAKGAPFDIVESNWVTDYFDPFNFLNQLFDSNIAPALSVNLARFDEPAYNRRLETAAKLTGAARYRTYAQLDADLTRTAAPIVVWGNPSSQDLFSARMGCQVYGPYGVDLAALCIRH